MNMQSALELCINKKVKVRRKSWSKNVYLEYDNFLCDIVIVIGLTNKKFSPGKDDILGEWEVYNDIAREVEEIKHCSEHLSDMVNKLCSKTVCCECPLNFNNTKGTVCKTLSFINKLKGVK